jgi:hypothetical protein
MGVLDILEYNYFCTKKTNTGPQCSTQKIKYWATRSHLNSRLNTGTPEGQVVPAALVAPVVFISCLQIKGRNNCILKYYLQ